MTDDIESRAGQRRHALYQDVVDKVEQQLVDHDVNATVAAALAEAVADMLADTWGGQVIAFPKDVLRRLTAKELEIYDQFDGRNTADLARSYGYTQRGMEKLIARIRAKIASQAKANGPQNDLFAPADSAAG